MGRETEPDAPLSVRDVADLCGCGPSDIARFVELGLLPEGPLHREDVTGLRLMLSLESVGIGLSQLAEAVRSGILSLDFTRHLMVQPIALSSLTFAQVCEDAGLEFAVVARAFAAAGLPGPEADRRAREDEVRLIRLLAATLQRGIAERAVSRILRILGHSMRRSAAAMRDLFSDEVEARLSTRGLSTAAMMNEAARHRLPLQETGAEVVRLLCARFLEEQVFENNTMHIQDALAASGLLQPRTVAPPAVLFVDLEGFALLTRQVGDRQAALKAAELEALAQETMAAFDGRVVKSLGDGLLLYLRNPACAVPCCLDLVRRARQAGLPEVHVGLAVGPVIHRDGDIFGNAVNLAARLANVAAPSELVADAVSVACIDTPSLDWRPAGAVTPRGMSEITVFRLDTTAPPERETTPD